MLNSKYKFCDSDLINDLIKAQTSGDSTKIELAVRNLEDNYTREIERFGLTSRVG